MTATLLDVSAGRGDRICEEKFTGELLLLKKKNYTSLAVRQRGVAGRKKKYGVQRQREEAAR